MSSPNIVISTHLHPESVLLPPVETGSHATNYHETAAVEENTRYVVWVYQFQCRGAVRQGFKPRSPMFYPAGVLQQGSVLDMTLLLGEAALFSPGYLPISLIIFPI